MGFLSRLFGGKEMPKPAANLSAPTVKAPPELSKAFSIVFYEVMGTVTPFTRADLDAMHETINSGKGHNDLSHWHRQVFETYFADKDCHWPELEEWNAVFAANGRKPILNAGRRKAFYDLLFQTIIGRAKNLSSKLRQIAPDVKWKIETPDYCAQDVPFVRLALEKNPDSIPPLFPGDGSLLIIDLEGVFGNWKPDKDVSKYAK